MSTTWEDITACAEALVKTAKEKSVTLATAESCTGGGIGAAITDVSGASAVFPGGIISYANDIKIDPLGVPEKLLIQHGAVSQQVAKSMAKGAVKLFKSDVAVAVTGIAGPGGGTANKPVGLVYIACASAAEEAYVRRFDFGDIGRGQVRMNTIFEALCLLGEQIHQS